MLRDHSFFVSALLYEKHAPSFFIWTLNLASEIVLFSTPIFTIVAVIMDVFLVASVTP